MCAGAARAAAAIPAASGAPGGGAAPATREPKTMDASQQDFEPLWDFERPAESEARFRDELSRHPAGSEAHAQLMTQIARTHSLRREFGPAHRVLDAVEAGLPAASPKVRARYELERGRTFNSAGDKARAAPLFIAAFERSVAAGLDYYAIDAAHMMAIVTPAEAQHAWNQQALDLTERTTDLRAKKWLVPLYNNIGWTFHDQKDYPAALEMFERALDAAVSQGRREPMRIAKWTIARCLRSLGRHQEALHRQIILRDDPTLDSAKDGYVFEEIGENLLALGRALEARSSCARAYALLRDDGYLATHEAARLARLRELGEGR